MTDQTDAKVYCPTYADIVANFSTVTQTHVNPTKNNPNEETVSPLQISDGEACQLAPTVLLACSVNMAKLKNFLTGIDKSVNESQILSYLNQRNIITPTYISIFQSRRLGSLSCKMQRPLGVSAVVEKEKFWPKFFTCKSWQPKNYGKIISQKMIKSTPNRSYSTLVKWRWFD